MKLNKYFLIGTIAIAGFSSCVSENIDDASKTKADKGLMALSVSLLQPESTRATTEVFDYPVNVYNSEGEQIKTYLSVAEVPETEVYQVGTYTVESHTPGTLGEGTTTQKPYYYGIETMEILKGQTTEVDVICKRQNGSVQVTYGDDFTNFYESWTITVDDGNGVAPVFPDANRQDPNFVYWKFREGLSTLNVNFTGVSIEKQSIKSRFTVTKGNADESYDDDVEYFTGGDAIVLSFKLKMDGHGTVTGIEITAVSTLFGEETTSTKQLEVTDSEDSFEIIDDGNGTGTGGNENNPDAITLTIPDPVTFTQTEAKKADPSSGDVSMSAENGLRSVMVKVESSSSDMMGELAAVAEGYEGVDLVNGCEVVGNQGLVSFLAGLNRQITVPAEGDTEYTFPVGQFYGFLSILPGTHNFIMTVTDMEGNKKTGTVVFNITE